MGYFPLIISFRFINLNSAIIMFIFQSLFKSFIFLLLEILYNLIIVSSIYLDRY